MSNYKNPFEPGGKFHNPRITDASRVTEPRIMPRWVEEKEMPYFNTEFYNIQTGMLIEKVVGDVQIISIEENKYFEYKDSFLPNMGFKRDFVSFIISKSKSDNNFHVLKGLNTAELNVRAFMATVTELEGGGYNLKYGLGGPGVPYTGNEHPGMQYKYDNEGNVIAKGSPAGAYQITKDTADRLYKKYPEITNFSPINQDKMALRLMSGAQNALKDVKNANFEIAIKKLTGQTGIWITWEALPGGSINSKSIAEFYTILNKHIIEELKNESSLATKQGDLLYF